tara:strand:- start:36 stop:617 length:582 start_codon:yes stop_codon:yes gene_type:complete
MNNVKKIVCIRHGTALHNVLYPQVGVEAYTKHLDTPLVQKGIDESNNLGKTWKERDETDLVIVSPSKRTLDTASNIFSGHSCKMIALDCVMEYPQGHDICNKRKNKKYLEKLYDNIDFSHIETNEPAWKDTSEFLQELYDRVERFKEFVRVRPEKNIVLVSHSSFLKTLMGMEMGDETNELNHCFPYIVKIDS